MYDCLRNNFPVYSAKKEAYPLDNMQMRDPQWNRAKDLQFFTGYTNPFPELYSERLERGF